MDSLEELLNDPATFDQLPFMKVLTLLDLNPATDFEYDRIDDAVFANETAENLSFRQSQIFESSFDQVMFQNSNFNRTEITDSNANKCVFLNCDFSHCLIQRGEWSRIEFIRCNLDNLRVSMSKFVDVNYLDCKADQIDENTRDLIGFPSAGLTRSEEDNQDAQYWTRSSPIELLRIAQQYSFDHYIDEVGADLLTPRQFILLKAISENRGLTQAELVGLTGIDRSTLADMISRLIKKGFLQRVRTKPDTRATGVIITAEGRRILNATEPKVREANSKMLSGLSSKQQSDLIEVLNAFVGSMEQVGAVKSKK